MTSSPMMIVLVGMATPSLYHVMFGRGTPRAEQFTRTGASNSYSVTTLRGMIFTSTGSKKEEEHNMPVSCFHSQSQAFRYGASKTSKDEGIIL